MTPREDAATTLLLLAGIAAVFGLLAAGGSWLRGRFSRCGVAGCVVCGGSWRDSETQA